jgi:thioredoxin reductase
MTAELLHRQVELDRACALVGHPSTRTNLPGGLACGHLVDHHFR